MNNTAIQNWGHFVFFDLILDSEYILPPESTNHISFPCRRPDLALRGVLILNFNRKSLENSKNITAIPGKSGRVQGKQI